ncbi:hypothetical protein ACPTGO_30890, partial [Pseudomonas aeruginosa]|uniref:hypothetical protein n=1 Tax=Pseudomonas aeruginosa TaxID=287 RepID=UPI003CC50671
GTFSSHGGISCFDDHLAVRRFTECSRGGWSRGRTPASSARRGRIAGGLYQFRPFGDMTANCAKLQRIVIRLAAY